MLTIVLGLVVASSLNVSCFDQVKLSRDKISVTCHGEVIVHHRPEEAGVSVNDQHHLTRIPRLPLGHINQSEASI